MTDQKRAVLCTDLTRYHEDLVLGIPGTVVGSPSRKSRFGSSYLTVKFDSGHTQNIIRGNLWVGAFPPPPKIAELIPDRYALPPTPTPIEPPSDDWGAQVEEKRRLIALWDDCSRRSDFPNTRDKCLCRRDKHKADLQVLLDRSVETP